MKRVYAHHPEGGDGDPIACVRDDETGDAYCVGCRLLVASSDEDEAFGLPVSRVVFDSESGWFVALCPDCAATFSKQA